MSVITLSNGRWFRPLIAVIAFLLITLFLRVASYDIATPTRTIAEYAKTHVARRDLDSEIKNSTLGVCKFVPLPITRLRERKFN